MIKELSLNELIGQTKKRAAFVWAMGLGLLILVLVFLALIPQAQSVWTTRQSLVKETADLDKLKQKIAQLDQIRYDTNYILSAQIVDSSIPDTKPLLQFLASLDQIARATTVNLVGLELTPGEIGSGSASLDTKSKTKGADSLPVTFKISGGFDQVTQFMELLEKIAPFTTITNYSVTENKSDANVVSVAIGCETHFANVISKTLVNTPIPQLTAKDETVLQQLKDFTQINLPEQKSIQGGLEDLFGLPKIDQIYSN